MHVVPVHHAVGVGRGIARKFDVVHPERRNAAHGGPINMDQHITDALQVGVGVGVEIDADVHPVRIGGGNTDSTKIILVVADGDAKLQVTEGGDTSIGDRGGTRSKTDIALKIRVLKTIERWRDRVKSVENLKLIWDAPELLKLRLIFSEPDTGLLLASLLGSQDND